MNLTHEQSARLNHDFATSLNALLVEIRGRAVNAFNHDMERNVPAGTVTPDEVVEHAIRAGLVSAMSAFHHFGIEPSIQLAAEILEDVNAHREAAPLFAILKEGAK